MLADLSAHWDQSNLHVRVVLTMRELTLNGFGLKVTQKLHCSPFSGTTGFWAHISGPIRMLHPGTDTGSG